MIKLFEKSIQLLIGYYLLDSNSCSNKFRVVDLSVTFEINRFNYLFNFSRSHFNSCRSNCIHEFFSIYQSSVIDIY